MSKYLSSMDKFWHSQDLIEENQEVCRKCDNTGKMKTDGYGSWNNNGEYTGHCDNKHCVSNKPQKTFAKVN